MGDILRRRGLMGETGPVPDYVYYTRSGTGNNKLPIVAPFEPELVVFWDLYRFSNSNWQVNDNNPFAIWSKTDGSYTVQLYANNAGNGKINTATFANSTLSTNISRRNLRSDHTFAVLAISGAALSGTDKVYVTSMSGNNTKTLTHNCPFTPKIALAYSTTRLAGTATSDTTLAVLVDNDNMGRYGFYRSSSDFITNTGSISEAQITTISPPNNYNFKDTNTYKIICIQ